MILMIDNYDSFTFNLVQYLGELGAEVKVVRNDEIDVAGIGALKPSHLILSPGPCTPNEAGVCVPAGKLARSTSSAVMPSLRMPSTLLTMCITCE